MSYTLTDPTAALMFAAAQETLNECIRQAEKFGENRHKPDTDAPQEISDLLMKIAQQNTDAKMAKGTETWADILSEEVMEAFAATSDPEHLITELIQVAAVCWTWIADIRSR